MKFTIHIAYASLNDLYRWWYLLCPSFFLPFLLGVTHPGDEPSQDDAYKEGAQEDECRVDGLRPQQKPDCDHLGVLEGKDDNQDGQADEHDSFNWHGESFPRNSLLFSRLV
jgi:hypothetical protein